jgi:peptidoglycan/xylan/chitin deacetylase (PgdA/CDA1 family)
MRIVSITFDDGFRSSAETAMPILERYRFKATFYVVTGLVEPAGSGKDDPFNSRCAHGTWDFWRKVVNAGHEVGGHSFSHAFLGGLVGFFPWTMAREIGQSARDLRRELPAGRYTMSMPYNSSSMLSRFYARRYFSACRIGSSYGEYNSITSHEPYKLRSWVFEPGHGLEDLALVLERLPEENWLILQFHTFGTEGWSPIPVTTFESLCAMIADHCVTVRTVKEVVLARH